MTIGQAILGASEAAPGLYSHHRHFHSTCSSPDGHRRNKAPAASTRKLVEFVFLNVAGTLTAFLPFESTDFVQCVVLYYVLF